MQSWLEALDYYQLDVRHCAIWLGLNRPTPVTCTARLAICTLRDYIRYIIGLLRDTSNTSAVTLISWSTAGTLPGIVNAYSELILTGKVEHVDAWSEILWLFDLTVYMASMFSRDICDASHFACSYRLSSGLVVYSTTWRLMLNNIRWMSSLAGTYTKLRSCSSTFAPQCFTVLWRDYHNPTRVCLISPWMENGNRSIPAEGSGGESYG